MQSQSKRHSKRIEHQACDWGLVSTSEWLANDEAFKSGGSTISRHMDESGNLFSIAGIAGKLNIELFPAEERPTIKSQAKFEQK